MTVHMPLEGIRVLEWSQWQQGPAAGMMLADLGAEVIKMEEPIGGDQARGIDRISGQMTFANGRNSYFEVNNRNKKGITVDLNTARGREIVYGLVAKSDVFLHNFRESSVAKMGMDYEILVKHNAKLVYVHVSGNGPAGPDRDDRSYDYTALARSGIMSMTGEPELPPQMIQGGVGDQAGSVMAAYATLAALLARERLGVGQKIETSMLGAIVWLQQVNVAMKLITGCALPRQSRKRQPSALYNHYQCGDGKWLVVACPQADRYWPGVIRAMGLEGDARFVDAGRRGEIVPELISRMDEVFLTKARSEWIAVLKQNGVVCAPLNDFDDLIVDAQVLANDYITEFDHPTWGMVKMPGVPFNMQETPGSIRLPAPELGQHTEEVLVDVLGYDWDRIVELRDASVI